MNESLDELAALRTRYEPWTSKNLECRELWKPKPVDWLVIAESPPCPRDEDDWDTPRYMYRIRKRRKGGQLLGAILSGFLHEDVDISKWKHAKRLSELRDNGVFVLDVCEYPVNRLPDDLRTDEVRKAMRVNFNDRLGSASPENVIVLGGLDEGEFGRVVFDGLTARHRELVRNSEAIPFPHWGNYAVCAEGIRRCVETTRKEAREST